MDKIRKIVRNNIEKIMLEEATQYLFERWSHSEDIDKAVEHIFDTIEKNFKDRSKKLNECNVFRNYAL